MAALREKFARARGIVLTEYKGLTAGEMAELRNSLRKTGIEYRVVRNTLAAIAAVETPAEAVRERFSGPVAVAMGYDDAAAVAKGVLDFAAGNEKLTVTCGVVDGIFCDEGRLKRIATLPPREVLLGMLAGTLQASTAKLARLLSATVARFGYALHALKEKKAA